MTEARLRPFVLTLALAAATIVPLSGQATPPAGREDAWRADLTFLAREFAAAHVDFAKLYPRARFDADLAIIERDVSTTPDTDIVLNLMRLVAGAHVGHTNIRIPAVTPAFHRLPLSVSWFSDGLAVTAASEPYRAALGLRVVTIGRLTPEQLESAVAPYIAYENDAWLHQQSPSFMVMHELLRRLGQLDDDGRVTITLARPDGATLAMSVAAGPWQGGPALVSATDALAIPRALFRKQPNKSYWYDVLPESHAVYVQYNWCADDPAQPFAAFTKALFADLDADRRGVDRIIIDLRFNGGGDSRIVAPLFEGIRARRWLTARGVYGLIGRATFSSALMAAVELRNNLKAVLVGEPPGEKPNSYGDVRQLTLPNSQLVVQYSTKFFRLMKGSDPPYYEPDVLVKRSIADALAGRDPVLEAAIGYGRKQSPAG